MMSAHVDNWPNPKKLSTAISLIDKTLHAALRLGQIIPNSDPVETAGEVVTSVDGDPPT